MSAAFILYVECARARVTPVEPCARGRRRPAAALWLAPAAWQSRLAQAGGAGRAAGALPLSHSSRAQRVPGATHRLKPILGLTFSTYLASTAHGLVLTILAQVGCTTPHDSHTAVRPSGPRLLAVDNGQRKSSPGWLHATT